MNQKKHVKVRFFTARTNLTLGASSNMGLGVSEQCWMYQIFCGVNLEIEQHSHLYCHLTFVLWIGGGVIIMMNGQIAMLLFTRV